MTEYQPFLTKRVYLLRYIEIFYKFYKRYIVLNETIVHNQNKRCQEWIFFFYWPFSDCTRDQNGHLNTKVFTKKFLGVHVSVRTLDFLYVRWTKNLDLVEPLVMGTHTLYFFLVISKFLDSTQYYMMLLEQCRHILAKVQVTVKWLDQDQIHVCSVKWLDY